jgi:GNAT superfamily N-acetyltransferase
VATADDVDTVVALRLALILEHGNNAIYGRIRPDARERARPLFAAQLRAEREVTFLAFREADAIGILRCVESAGSPLHLPAHYGYVSSVYVIPEERRGGLLGRLMREAEGWCRSRGLTEMRLHNAPENSGAIEVWERMGFEVVEQLRLRILPSS